MNPYIGAISKWKYLLLLKLYRDRCTFKYPNWANHCSPSLDCTGQITITKAAEEFALHQQACLF